MRESRPTYQFGPFHLEVDRRLLRRGGEPVALAPKALETLLALIEHRDRVVTKDELLQRIWGDTVVEEGGLTRNISVLRKALGETPDEHQYIVTVPGRGYRFVAEAVEVGEPAEETPSSDLPAVGVSDEWPVTETGIAATRKRSWLLRAVALGGLAALAAVGLVYSLKPAPSVDPGRPQIRALAVLPLDNLSGDPTQEYFADGMTEALIGNLARIRALRVVSRTSVMRFRGAKRPLAEIARALNVDAIVEGSVQRTSDRVRISVQLVHAATDAHLWAREYERELTDILKLQGDVARAVAEEIQVQITAEERARLASVGTVNPAAYQEYLLGQHYLWRLNEEDLGRAIDHFERAVRLDAGYAAAHAGLSHAWWWRGVWGAKTPKQVKASSRAAALRALELDPQLAEAHVSIGRIKFCTSGTGQAPNRISAAPSKSTRTTLTRTSSMGCCSWRSDASPNRSLTSRRLSNWIHSRRPCNQASAGSCIARADSTRPSASDPGLGVGAADRRQLSPACRCLRGDGQVRRRAGLPGKREPDAGAAVGCGASHCADLRTDGKADEARRIIRTQHTGKPAWLESASAYAALDDNDEAFRLLFRMFEERDGLNYVKTDPRLDRLHQDPRWQLLLKRMTFPTDAESNAASR